MEGLLYYLSAEVVDAVLRQIPRLPTKRMIFSIMTRKSRKYFSMRRNATMWQTYWEDLKKRGILNPSGWSQVREVHTCTRGARRLKLDIVAPGMSFPNSFKCPPDVSGYMNLNVHR